MHGKKNTAIDVWVTSDRFKILILTIIMNSKEFYDLIAKKYDSRHENATTRYIRKVEKNFIKNASGLILDIGCGTGYHLTENSIGIDPSIEMLKEAKSSKVMQANAEDLPFHDNSFDSILCLFTVLNLCDYNKVIKEMNRVLKKDGLVFLSVTSVWDRVNKPLIKRFGNPVPRMKNVRIENYRLRFHLFNKKELVELFKSNGFRLERFHGIFILQKPYWGWFREFSLFERIKLKAERVLPKKAARMYFAVFRKI